MRRKDIELIYGRIKKENGTALIGKIVMIREQNDRTVEGKVKKVNTQGKGSCIIVTENGEEKVRMKDLITIGSIGKKGKRPGREQKEDDGGSILERILGLQKIPAA